MMKRYLLCVIGVICIMLCHALAYADVPSEIAYQGKLKEYGQVVNGTRNIQFKIYDAPSGGSQIGPARGGDVQVINGLFSYPIELQDIDLCKGELWIETIVQNKILSPREKITASSYALHALNSEGMQQQAGKSIDFFVGADKKANINIDGTMSCFVNGTSYYMVPQRAIIMWSGAITSIPAGWHLCDGDSGTPDLRDKFVMSVQGKNEDPGAIGGAHYTSIQIQNLPSHQHVGITEPQSDHHSHGNSIGNSGEHAHDIEGGNHPIVDAGSPGPIAFGNNIHLETQTQPKWQATSTGSHSHVVTIKPEETDHTHMYTTSSVGNNAPIDNRPAFYKLAFIMKL